MNNKDIIFAPSLSNDRTLSNRLTSFISKNKIFQLYIKCNEQTEITNVIIKPFFNNYFDNIRNAKFVFIGSLFNYRVSGVAIDSLALKTPIVGFKCKFMMEMKKIYPSLVFIINKYNDLNNIALNNNYINIEYENFIRLHDDNKFLLNVLRNTP